MNTGFQCLAYIFTPFWTLPGRPKGSFGKSKLDGREAEIKRLLALEVSKASIAKITGVDKGTSMMIDALRGTLYHFIKTRGLI